jgi:hypothetical protein
MNKQSTTVVTLLLMLASAASVLFAAESAPPAKNGKTLRLLTVGNSFSQDATRFLGDIARAAGNVLMLRQANISGGGTLEQHWEKVQLHQHTPASKLGFYSTQRSLKEELQAEPWNFVTLQQANLSSHDVSTYRPYAGRLCEYIHKYAPGAEVLLHQTWAYRCDDPRFTVGAARAGEPATQAAMYQGLSTAYGTIAAELNARIIPVGDAFYLADTDPQWGYRPDATFDFRAARYPALPNQTHSLHTGWKWTKGAGTEFTLHIDGHHAGPAGQYLAACTFYEVLFGESVVGNTFVPPGIEPAYARFLQETAHRAVLKSDVKKGGGQRDVR